MKKKWKQFERERASKSYTLTGTTAGSLSGHQKERVGRTGALGSLHLSQSLLPGSKGDKSRWNLFEVAVHVWPVPFYGLLRQLVEK